MNIGPFQLPQFGDQYDPQKARALVEELERLILQLTKQNDDIPQETAANLSDQDSAINTVGKKDGKLVIDTTNSRLMYALGATPTSDWRVVDGSASVTPS